jgi:phospholipid/cholesterol/gamma-HCH transport system substrate-binding protein
MDAKREQALVGLFVVVAAGLLLATVFALSGAFTRATTTYRAYFKFAGGLEPGKGVRYAGGLKIGRVENVRVDPDDASRMEITFSVAEGTPIKKDTTVKIAALSALGENYLELKPGKKDAPDAKPGDALPSVEFFSLSDLGDTLSDLKPKVTALLDEMNGRIVELRETIARVNDLINERNRDNVAASLSNVRGMLEENRPKVKSTLSNLDATSAKMPALVDDFKKTVADADKALKNIDDLLGENRKDVRESIQKLHETLNSASSLVSQLDHTMGYNAENIDELLENMRMTTENLKQFTDTIKVRPYTLIRSSSPPDRKPGAPPPKQ